MRLSAFILGAWMILLLPVLHCLGEAPRAVWTTSRVRGAPYPPAPYAIPARPLQESYVYRRNSWCGSIAHHRDRRQDLWPAQEPRCA